MDLLNRRMADNAAGVLKHNPSWLPLYIFIYFGKTIRSGDRCLLSVKPSGSLNVTPIEPQYLSSSGPANFGHDVFHGYILLGP